MHLSTPDERPLRCRVKIRTKSKTVKVSRRMLRTMARMLHPVNGRDGFALEAVAATRTAMSTAVDVAEGGETSSSSSSSSSCLEDSDGGGSEEEDWAMTTCAVTPHLLAAMERRLQHLLQREKSARGGGGQEEEEEEEEGVRRRLERVVRAEFGFFEE